MKKIIIYVSIVVMFFVSQKGYTQKESTDLNSYLEIAAKNNPAVKAAFNQYLASLEKVPQLGSLPDPQATFGVFIKPMELLGGNQTGNVQIMQMFPWFGTIKTAKDEASMMANAKYEAFNSTKSELFYQVKAAWYQLMKYDQEIKLITENIALLESLEKLALLKFESPGVDVSTSPMQKDSPMNNKSSSGSTMGGMNNQNASNNNATSKISSVGMSTGMSSKQSGLSDVLRVKMEILEQKNNLEIVLDQRQTERVKFNALLNRAPETEIQIFDSLIVSDLHVDRLAIPDSILENNPMLAMLKNEEGSYLFMEEKAKKMGSPMMGVGLNYMLIQKREGNPSMMNGKDMLMPMVSMTIPIYRKKYNAMQNEARLMQEATIEQTNEMRNNLMVEYRQFIQRLNDAERRIALYQEQEELARKTTDLLLSGFTSSGADYEEVLRMQLKVLDYGFKHIDAISDYNTSVAMAERLMNSLTF